MEYIILNHYWNMFHEQKKLYVRDILKNSGGIGVGIIISLVLMVLVVVGGGDGTIILFDFG